MLPNLPEDSLFDLLPAGLQDEDERSIIRALIGGFQARYSDFRFFANALTELMDPEKCAPVVPVERSYTETILVATGGAGVSVTLSRYADRVESVTLNGTALTRSDVLATPTSYAVGDNEVDTVITFGNGTSGALVPDASTVEVVYVCITGRTLEVAFTSDYGKTIYRTLDITEDTPTAVGERRAWAAQQLGIEQAAITGLTEGTDPLRQISGSALSHLAATIGGVLYRDPTHTDAQAVAEWRRQIAAVFPRVRIKGTAKSFDVLGRLIGFSAARVVPLWGRVSPRLPHDPGSAVNDPDFKTSPQIPLESPVYDQDNISDGPFYVWNSAVMSNDITRTDYIPSVVNGLNPFIRVVLASEAPVLPEVGYYTLDGGTSNAPAYVDLNSKVRVLALGPGEGFNGIRVEVLETESGLAFRVQARLSKIKYRTSLYELAMLIDAEAMRSRYGLEPVTDSPDALLIDTDHLESTCPNGKPITGGWSGPSRFHAPPDTQQHRTGILDILGAQAVQAMEEVRPATRFPRRVTTGLCLSDEVRYAPVQNSALSSDIGTIYRRPLSVSHVGTRRRVGTFLRAGTYNYAYEYAVAARTAMHTARILACDPYDRVEQLSELVGRNILTNDSPFTGTLNIDTGIYAYSRDSSTDDYAEVTVAGAEFAPTWTTPGPYRFYAHTKTTVNGGGYVTITLKVYADSARTVLLHEQSVTGGTPGEVPDITWAASGSDSSRTLEGPGSVTTFLPSGPGISFRLYLETYLTEMDEPGNFVTFLRVYNSSERIDFAASDFQNGSSFSYESGSVFVEVTPGVIGFYEIRHIENYTGLAGTLSGIPLCPDGLDFEIFRRPARSLEVEWHPTSTEVVRPEPIAVEYRSGFVASIYNGSFDGRAASGTTASVDWVTWKDWQGDAYVRLTAYGTSVAAQVYHNPDSAAQALTASNYDVLDQSIRVSGLIDAAIGSFNVGAPHTPVVTNLLLQRNGPISGVTYQDRPEDELRLLYDSIAFAPAPVDGSAELPATEFTGWVIYGTVYDSSDFFNFYEIELNSVVPNLQPGDLISHIFAGDRFTAPVVSVSPGTSANRRIVEINNGGGFGPDLGATVEVLLST